MKLVQTRQTAVPLASAILAEESKKRIGTMRLFNSIVLSFGLAALVAGAYPVAMAQAAPPSADSASPGVTTAGQSSAGANGPVLKAYSRLTVVDVTVIGNKGQPVHGLSKADFTIKEDGKAQPVEGFLETGEDKAASQRAAPKLPPDVYTNAQSAPAGSAVNVLLSLAAAETFHLVIGES